MRFEHSVLYEQFVAARREAVALTDHYRATGAEDPSRAELWERVVRQTETARGLLESWLQSAAARRTRAVGRTPRPRSLERG
jgi:hypothetical protein